MNDETDIAEPTRHHSIGARIMAAIGFSAVGAKIGFLAIPVDLSNLVGSKLTLNEKFKAVFSKQVINKFKEKASSLVDKAGKSSEQILAEEGIAMFKVMKWSTIVGIVGSVIGAAVGWIQGGKIENWKDIFTHPIRSTKIIFGIEKPASEMAAKRSEPAVVLNEIAPSPAKEWAKDITPRSSHETALVQEKASQTAPSIS